MSTFKETLATLPDTRHIAELRLRCSDESTAVLPNQPGTSGSVSVYYAISRPGDNIDATAAKLGLALYAEHSEDARLHPGKHPNIDRLFAIIEGNLHCRLSVTPVPQ